MSSAPVFIKAHKKTAQSFTRTRKLPFRSILQLLLRKSVKSLQLMLIEWFGEPEQCSTPSAYSQARRKFKHTAFIELLNKGVIEVMYNDGEYAKYKGHRLLAIDGSSLRLPNTSETRKHFGVIRHLNGNKTEHGSQVEAKMSVMYDVLNEIPISAYLHKGRCNDLKAGASHLGDITAGDIVIADRAYGSYEFFAKIMGKNADFIIRCKHKTFERYHGLFSDTQVKEVIADVEIPSKIAIDSTLPKTLKLRFLRIPLSNGEVEVLATSLLDRKKFSHAHFKKLYYSRWRIETYFNTLKSRLCIDNFTGKSVESIYQDFYSTIFISGLESIIALEANETLRSKDTIHPQKVNKAVSFHTIKDKVISLIFEQPPDFQQQITNLFLLNPTSVRKDRIHHERDIVESGSNRRSLYFQRYAKKHVF